VLTIDLVLVDANPDFNRKSRTWRYKPSEEDLFRILLGLPGKVHTEGSAKVPISYEPRSGPEADLFILEFLTYLWFFSNMIFATLELVGPTNAMELWFTSGSRSRRREPRFRISRIMSQLLQRHTIQSVFSPKTVPLSNSQEVVVGQIITWLLAETSWHFATTDLENSLQRLRREATILPGSDVFPKLQKLRRQVADARILIAEARKLCVGPIWDASQWSVGGETVSAEGFWAQKPNAPNRAIYGRPQVMDIRRLSDSFDKFKKMIDEMTITITEEMQMVIGSVQVEDAKTMKRQTECTVVLAVLATIYLPMTLVTGVFGMNIQEINDDETRPDKWSTINTWALTFGATIGCIAVYAAGRWPVKWLMTKREKSRTRRQFLDLEAMKLE
jgi:Mg2+ and Co2+ transporter CorA